MTKRTTLSLFNPLNRSYPMKSQELSMTGHLKLEKIVVGTTEGKVTSNLIVGQGSIGGMS